MRELRVLSSERAGDIKRVSIDSNSTWGDVKRLAGLSGSNWTGVGRTSRTTYIDDSSVIHDNDEQINAFPKKMKAGLDVNEWTDILADLDTLRTRVIDAIAEEENMTPREVMQEAGIDVPEVPTPRRGYSRDAADDVASNLGLG